MQRLRRRRRQNRKKLLIHLPHRLRPARHPGDRTGGLPVWQDLGAYRHFKGKEYEVLGIARHSETEEELVVYRALYGDFGLWVRPVSMWNETVERDGKTFRRFTYIGE